MTTLSTCRGPFRGFVFSMLFALLASHPSAASTPGLQLPPWLEVGVTLSDAPELQRPFVVRGSVKVLLGKLDGARYVFHLPAGVQVVSGEPRGIVTASAGVMRQLELRLRVKSPAPDASITLDLLAPYPREAIQAEIRRLYAAEAQEDVEALESHLATLKGEHTFTGMATFSTTEQEGFGSQAEDAFLEYFRPLNRDDFALALLAGRSEPPEGGWSGGDRASQARELFARNPKLAELFRKSGRDPEALASRQEADDYTAALRELQAGRYREAQTRFHQQAADAGRSLLQRFAAGNGKAAALFAQGMTGEATALWQQLASEKLYGTLARYAHFNLGEALRIGGRADEARANYERALELKRGYTLARQRLHPE
jgi:tetratricopeptide (TPR) repeat protein